MAFVKFSPRNQIARRDFHKNSILHNFTTSSAITLYNDILVSFFQ